MIRERISPTVPRGRRKTLKLFFAVLMVLLAVAAAFFLPVRQYLVTALDWKSSLGPWGPLFLVAVYVIACVAFLLGRTVALGWIERKAAANPKWSMA